MLARKTFFGGNDGWGREDWAPGACQRYDYEINIPPGPKKTYGTPSLISPKS